MRDELTQARLVALFFLGALLWNFPILSLANRALAVVGIPRLVAYSFLSWAALIFLIFLVVELGDRARREPDSGAAAGDEAAPKKERASR